MHLSIHPNFVVSALAILKSQLLGIGQFCIDLNFCCKMVLAIIVGDNNLNSEALMHWNSERTACLQKGSFICLL